MVGWALIAVAAHYLWIFFMAGGIVLINGILGGGWGVSGFDGRSAVYILGSDVIPGGLLLGAGISVLKRVETVDRGVGIRVLLVVAAAFFISYASEMIPIALIGTYSGGAPQFGNFTFAEQVERSHLVVIGVVTDVGVKVFPEDVMDVDEHGNEYVFEHNRVPRAEVTLQILEVLKDDLGWSSDRVTFYDDVNVPIGRTDIQATRLVSQHTIDYQKGDWHRRCSLRASRLSFSMHSLPQNFFWCRPRTTTTLPHATHFTCRFRACRAVSISPLWLFLPSISFFASSSRLGYVPPFMLAWTWPTNTLHRWHRHANLSGFFFYQFPHGIVVGMSSSVFVIIPPVVDF